MGAKSASDRLALLGGQPVIAGSVQAASAFGIGEVEAALEVLRTGPLSGFVGAPGPGFVGGRFVRYFEAAWADRFEVDHAISMNSATSCLVAAVGASGVGPGDEVIVPPLTMSATAIAPLPYGGIPVFADVDQESFCLDLDAVKKAVSDKTKAIIAVNLFGHPARLRDLRQLSEQLGIVLIEDNSQSPGAREYGRLAGTVGHIGVFSLNVHKHMNSGEGGVCVTRNRDLALRLQLIRNHGENLVESMEIGEIADLYGFNFRMTELTAAIAIEQLKKLDDNIARRRAVASVWSDTIGKIAGISAPVTRNDCEHVYLTWASKFDTKAIGLSRQKFSEALRAEGVPNNPGYVVPLYRLPLFRERMVTGARGVPFGLGQPDYRPKLYPTSERLHFRELLLLDTGLFEPDSEQVQLVVRAFEKVFDHRDTLRESNPEDA